MVRPTPRQVAQIAVLAVAFLVGINVLVAVLAFGATVVTGMWTDRP
jgi:hypothetical protein